MYRIYHLQMTLLYSLRKVLYIANVNGDLICLRFGHHPKKEVFYTFNFSVYSCDYEMFT